MLRPAILLLSVYLAAFLSSVFYGGKLMPIAGVAMILLLTYYFHTHRKDTRKWIFPGVMLFLFVAGLIQGRTLFADERKASFQSFSGDTAGIVTTVENRRYGTAFILREEKTGNRIRVEWNGSFSTGEAVVEGDHLQIHGKAQALQIPENPGGWNSLFSDRAKGIRYTVRADAVERQPLKFSPYRLRYLFRSSVEHALSRTLPPEQEGVILAILTGDRSEMDTDMKSLFQDAGIAHIIAISGLHIQILAEVLEKMLKRCIGRRKAVMMTTCLLWLYCFISGAAVSTMRACLMLSIRTMGMWVGRKDEPLNTLAFSALLMLFIRPANLFTSGFQLSFLASFALITGKRPFMRWFRIPYPIRRVVASSLAVLVWSAPVTLYFFHQISLVSVLLNLLVIPLMSIVVVMSMLSAILTLLWQPAAAFCSGSVYYVLRFYQLLCTWMLSIPGAVLKLGQPSACAIIAWYTMLSVPLIGHRMRHKNQHLMMIVCGFVLIMTSLYTRYATRITFLSVGQGDCAVVESDGRTWILDAGPGYTSVLKPYLSSRGITHIDGIFLSHMDKDHSEGVVSLLQDPDFTVDQVFLPDAAAHDFTDLPVSKRVEVVRLTAGDAVKSGALTFHCLSPLPGTIYADENSASLCLQLQTKTVTIDFMGDADQESEAAMIARREDLSCDILKVGHHGSNTSSSIDFLRESGADIAWISCGENNSYGHPHAEVLKRLEEAGIVPVISWQSGAYMVRSNKGYGYKEAWIRRWIS